MNIYKIVRPSTTVGKIRLELQGNNQAMFPVVQDDDTYVGLIYATDLRSCDEEDTALDVFKSVTDREIFVFENQPSTTAKDEIKRRKLQFMPVVDFNHRYN